nr:hypothetical protein [Candidatus Sigynarchaeota archaeon]
MGTRQVDLNVRPREDGYPTILIANAGNRDVVFKGEPLGRDNIRAQSEELLRCYDRDKQDCSFPILAPYFDAFGASIKQVYLIVTDQGDEKYRNSDTLFFGEIIKTWLEASRSVSVTIIKYAFNPAKLEDAHQFFSWYFAENETKFSRADKRIISLSGGTPQMNSALHLVLSFLFPVDTEFYQVKPTGQLDPVNAEKTITRLFLKSACKSLLDNFDYQGMLNLLEPKEFEGKKALVLLLQYAWARKHFDFDAATVAFNEFLKLVPEVEKAGYERFRIPAPMTAPDLIKDLVWNTEIQLTTQDYTGFVARLFRLEEAVLQEILNLLFDDLLPVQATGTAGKTGNKKSSIADKQTHGPFVQALAAKRPDLHDALKRLTFKSRPVELGPGELARPVMFYIAWLENEKANHPGKKTITNLLSVFDRINKYRYDSLTPDDRGKYYKDRTGSECLGDLRNSSIIAHGFTPVSSNKIESLYKDDAKNLLARLKEGVKALVGLLGKQQKAEMDNGFIAINEKINILLRKI